VGSETSAIEKALINLVFVGGDTPKAQAIIAAISEGARQCGDQAEICDDVASPRHLDCDFVGLYGLSRIDWLQFCIREQQPFLYFDKGYRRQEPERDAFWRVGVNETHPTEYVSVASHNDGRLTKLQKGMGLSERMRPWRASSKDSPIVIASSSEKFHILHNLPPPRDWVADTIGQLRKHTNRPIFYRPKPSWGDPGPIDGSKCVVDIKHMSQLFKGCHALVTYGSYICVDAMLEGVPSIILGNGVIRDISSTDLAEVEEPRLADEDDRKQIMANLAWCQYTVGEWSSGIAWRLTKRLFIEGLVI
jgi:hypothetical protein